jgi:hypothetical protein
MDGVSVDVPEKLCVMSAASEFLVGTKQKWISLAI